MKITKSAVLVLFLVFGMIAESVGQDNDRRRSDSTRQRRDGSGRMRADSNRNNQDTAYFSRSDTSYSGRRDSAFRRSDTGRARGGRMA
ncbi:MAG: hypothetical protein EOP49_40775, partial [Sphingobacteriales bacterium]